MKYCLFFIYIILFSFCQNGFSQSIDSTLSQTYRPKFALKFNVLPLLDYTPTIQFGLEVGTTEKQSIHIDYGYIKDLHLKRTFTGFKLKGEYRFYKSVPNQPNILKFRGFQYMYKQVVNPTTTFIWRNNQTYQERINYTISNQTHSIFAIGGFAFNTSKPFGCEASLGLGYRRLEVSAKDVPDDVNIPWSSGRNILQPNSPGTLHLPAVFLNFRILWRIG